MKKLACVLAALGLFAPTSIAQARSDVTGAHVNPDPAAVRAFWTPARMRSATPADIVRSGGPAAPAAKPGSGGGGGGGSTSTSPSTALVAPWPATADQYTNGKVYFQDGSWLYVCSGTAVSSTNGSVVWTAGHCVNDGAGGAWVTNWIFKPAYNSGAGYPDFVATQLYTTTAWADSGDFGGDVGAAVVDTDATTGTLTNTIGTSRNMSFSPVTTTGTGHTIKAYGYPAEGKFSGETLYYCDTYVSTLDNGTDMGIPCALNGGSSGGAWIDKSGNQVSNNSYTYRGLKNVMFGPLLGSAAQQVLYAAEGTRNSGTTGTTL